MSTIVGVLLAAGAGRRAGGPEGVAHRVGRHVLAAAEAYGVLFDGGCDRVVVVLGALASTARPLLDNLPVTVVEADRRAQGVAASLRAGIAAAGSCDGVRGAPRRPARCDG